MLPGPALARARGQRVSGAMSAHPRCVLFGVSLFDAVETLLQSEFGILPVVQVEGGPVVGMLSRRDLLAAMLAMARIALNNDGQLFGEVDPCEARFATG